MALVLCTGVHTTLVHTRKLMLEKADHEVVAALDHSSLNAACRQHRFDVAVICQSGSPELKREWASLIRKHGPSIKLLEIYSRDSGKAVRDADEWLEAPATPAKLLGSLATLTGERKPSRKRRSVLINEVRGLCAKAIEMRGSEFYDVVQELSQALELLEQEDN